MKCSRIIERLDLVTVILAVCLCSVKAKAGCPKRLGKDAFPQLRIPLKGQEPQTCASSKTCCSRQLETTLQQKAVADLNGKVSKRLHGVKGSTTALHQEIRGYFKEIVRNAKEKSLFTLRQSHANLSRIGGPLVTNVFDQLEESIHNNGVNFTRVVLRFLTDSFPPLFNYVTGETQRFSDQFEKCLKDKVNFKQLYGGSPHKISVDIENIVHPMQAFLKGLVFSEKAINGAKQLDFTNGCSKILLQMTYCSMCNGEDGRIKPCEAYCIDVLKNCFVTSGRIQKKWSSFFDAMDNLVMGLSTHNVQQKLFQVYNRLSAAVAQVIPQIHDASLKKNMYKLCGSPTYGKGPTSTKGMGQTSHTVHAGMKQKMQDVKTKMVHIRSVFEEMPRDICVHDQVSALRTEKIIVARCWNGTAIGRYIGPVSSPLPSLDTKPADQSRIETMLQQTETMTKDIIKHTPDYYPTEIDGSGGSGSGGSGCDENDEDCGSAGSGGKNDIETTDSAPTKRQPNDNDIDFETTDSSQDGGVNANALGKAANVTPMLSLIISTLALCLRI